MYIFDILSIPFYFHFINRIKDQRRCKSEIKFQVECGGKGSIFDSITIDDVIKATRTVCWMADELVRQLKLYQTYETEWREITFRDNFHRKYNLYKINKIDMVSTTFQMCWSREARLCAIWRLKPLIFLVLNGSVVSIYLTKSCYCPPKIEIFSMKSSCRCVL